MVDFTTYQPPGVYVEEDSSPIVAPTGTSPTVVGIVGPSVGYRTNTETIVLTGTTAVQLAKLGIDPASVVVTGTDGTVYVAVTDYTLTAGPGVDASLVATADNTLTIARNGSGIPSGTTVHISYQYTDASYNAPRKFQDYDDVKDWYGDPFNTVTGALISPVSLAAKMAFDRGASIVTIVATAGSTGTATRTDLSEAYAKLTAVADVDIVVPLPVGIAGTALAPGDVVNVATDLDSALLAAADDSLYRVGLVGYDSGVTVDPLTIAAGVNERRTAVVWPNRLSYWNGYTNSTIEIGGYYLAAAIAGVLANQPVQEPLTKKNIGGFSGIPAALVQTMTKTQKNAWSSGGLMVVEIDRNGAMNIRHGVTTDMSSVTTRELSLVRSKDSLVTLIDSTVTSAKLVGTTIDENTPIAIKGVVAGALETAVRSGIIVNYNNLKVRQTSADPSVIEVKFAYQPAYPLNYIVISFSIDVTTGTTDLAA